MVNTDITAPDVTANVTGGFDGTVNASDAATIHADTIDGTFDGGQITLVANDSVGRHRRCGFTGGHRAVRHGQRKLEHAGHDGQRLAEHQPAGQSGRRRQHQRQQLVVEGFTLPRRHHDRGERRDHPAAGLAIALITPGGPDGKPQMILVHSVQRLGQLLAEGYVAIVIDLTTGDEDSQSPIQLSER